MHLEGHVSCIRSVWLTHNRGLNHIFQNLGGAEGAPTRRIWGSGGSPTAKNLRERREADCQEAGRAEGGRWRENERWP
jgi:hypothetical protein